MRAIWNGLVLAESDETKRVEGHYYFPPDSVRWEALEPSPSASWCYWKGRARYYDIVSADERNPDAAWSYPKPWPLARRLRDYVAFWRGVQVVR